MIVLGLLVLLITIVYYYLNNAYKYWEKLGVNGPKPHFIIGNLGKSIILKESPAHIFTKIYKAYKTESIVGIYRGTSPSLLVRDPEVIKELLVKSFNHFQDNDFHLDKKYDPIMGRNIFFLNGEEWKTVRSQLSPGFTSGKMKWLYPLLEVESEHLVKFIAQHGEPLESKELCNRFTLNNVASCAFGIEGKCFEDENSEFRQLSRDFFASGSSALMVFYLATLLPSLPKYLRVRMVPKKVETHLIQMVSETLRHRKENNIIRNDFLQILIDLKKNCTAYEFTDVDVTAQAAAFFTDGTETSSVVMSFVLFCLAQNHEVQTKLRQKINQIFDENDDTIPYDSLTTLSYLDAVVNESLRVFPPLLHLQKLCTKDFSLTTKTNQKLVIKKDSSIIIPIYGLHCDPKYHPEPLAFKPERFLENKVENYTFLPFGEGPRACIGKRFGVLQVKIGVAYILRQYQITVNRRTQLPIQFEPKNVLTEPVGGLWLNFEKI